MKFMTPPSGNVIFNFLTTYLTNRYIEFVQPKYINVIYLILFFKKLLYRLSDVHEQI